MPITYEDRLTSRYRVEPETGCWIWTGTLTWGGYGQIARHGRNVTAHRAMWELHNEAIPEGLCLDHLCLDRACVRPEHLELVTYSENNFRRFQSRTPVHGVTSARIRNRHVGAAEKN
jgi:hypothetical protein